MGEYTRYDDRRRIGRVLDLAIYSGAVEMKCKV